MKLGPFHTDPRVDLHEEPRWYGTGGPIGISILLPVTAVVWVIIGPLWGVAIGFLASFTGLIVAGRAQYEHANLVIESSIMVFGIEVLIGILYYDVVSGGRVPLWWYVLLVGLTAYGTTRAIPTIRAWLDWRAQLSTAGAADGN